MQTQENVKELPPVAILGIGARRNPEGWFDSRFAGRGGQRSKCPVQTVLRNIPERRRDVTVLHDHFQKTAALLPGIVDLVVRRPAFGGGAELLHQKALGDQFRKLSASPGIHGDGVLCAIQRKAESQIVPQNLLPLFHPADPEHIPVRAEGPLRTELRRVDPPAERVDRRAVKTEIMQFHIAPFLRGRRLLKIEDAPAVRRCGEKKIPVRILPGYRMAEDQIVVFIGPPAELHRFNCRKAGRKTEAVHPAFLPLLRPVPVRLL